MFSEEKIFKEFTKEKCIKCMNKNPNLCKITRRIDGTAGCCEFTPIKGGNL